MSDAHSSKRSTRVLMQTFCLFVCYVAYSFVFPFFPFLSSYTIVFSIVFSTYIRLFGEPSCGEKTLLNSPSEQTMVYIPASKRHSVHTYEQQQQKYFI